MTSVDAAKLLPQELLVALDRSGLIAKQRIAGTMQGKRRSKQMGSSLEFADYRLYSPGDDIRQLDWNAYGRTGKPFIKLFMDEQELPVQIYVDGSASMTSPASIRGTDKFLYAKQLAASIGYLTLNSYDRVGVTVFSSEAYDRLPMVRGRASISRLFRFLEQSQASETGDIASVFRSPGLVPRKAGMTWIISDFLYESGVEEALSTLLAAKQEVMVIQVLSPEEVNPDLIGDLQLIDVELKSGKEVAISDKLLRDYKQVVEDFTSSLRGFCYERGMGYQLLVTDTPLFAAVTETFRRNGWIQ